MILFLLGLVFLQEEPLKVVPVQDEMKKYFSKEVEVFGLKVYATESYSTGLTTTPRGWLRRSPSPGLLWRVRSPPRF